MDFSLTSEQTLLRESASRFLSETDLHGPALWAAFAELGWLGLAIPETHGGLGLGPVEVAILAEELGRHRLAEPFVAETVLAAGLLADAGARQDLLPGIADGSVRLALAHLEPGARACLAHVATTATRANDAWALNGEKTAALGADSASFFLVTARTSGSVRDLDGITLFLLPRTFDGLHLETHAAVDGSTIGVLRLADAVTPDALTLDAYPLLEAAIRRALAAWSAEAVGAMDALLRATIEYTSTRVQFGRPTAANQAVRHRLADMAVALEEARSLALRATLVLDDRAVTAARVKVGRAARFVAEQAVQLHGAMGVTEELSIGAYLRRLLALETLFGSPDEHLRRHAALRSAP